MDADHIIFAVDNRISKERLAKLSEIENSSILSINSNKYPNGFKRELRQAYNKAFKKLSDFQITDDDLFVDSCTMYEVYKGIVSGVHVSCFKTGGINMETVYLTNGDEVVVNGYLKDGCPLSDYLERNDSIVRTDECEDIYVYRDGMIDTFVIRY